MRDESRPCTFELLSELRVVVDFAVVGEDACSIRGTQGLCRVRGVDDGEATYSEVDRFSVVVPFAVAVGPPMAEPVRHPHQIHALATPDETSNSTHRGPRAFGVSTEGSLSATGGACRRGPCGARTAGLH